MQELVEDLLADLMQDVVDEKFQRVARSVTFAVQHDLTTSQEDESRWELSELVNPIKLGGSYFLERELAELRRIAWNLGTEGVGRQI